MSELEKTEEAIEIYDKVMEKYSDEYDEETLEKILLAYDYKAIYLAEKGDELGALEVYKKIIKSNWINKNYLSDKFEKTKINMAYLLRRTGTNKYNVDIKQLLKYGIENGDGTALINSALISINEKKYEDALNNFFSIKDNSCLEWWTKSLNDDDKEKYIVIYLGILSGKYHTEISCIEEIEKKLSSFNLQYIVDEFGKIVEKDEYYKEVVLELEDKEGSAEVVVSKDNLHL